MKLLLFSVFTLFSTAWSEFLTCTPTRDGWFSLDSSCFYFVDKPGYFSWDEAKEYCEDRQSSLASITNKDEAEYIQNAFSEKVIREEKAWIGLIANGFESNFEWVDENTPFDFEQWLAGIPNTTLARTCVTVNQDGKWETQDCDSKTEAFICKKDKPHIPLGNCPTGWERYEDKCYKSFGNRTTFNDASNACMEFGNSTLVSIKNKEQQNFLTLLVGFETVNLWIGLQKSMTFGKHFWLDQTDFKYINWAKGEPSDIKFTEPCVEILVDPSQAGKWNDVACSALRGYICQIEPDISYPVPSPLPSLCPQEGYERYQNACYKIETLRLNFESAEQNCQKSEGHLTSVMNKYEHAYIKEMTRKRGITDYWVGYSDRDPKYEGMFRWTDGWPSYFASWGNNEPGGDFKGQRCVGETTLNWHTYKCDSKLSYVCKINDDTPPAIEVVNGTCPISTNSSFEWIDEGTSHCFYIETKITHTWNEALKFCTSAVMGKNVNLASFHSKHEIEVLRKHVDVSENRLWIGLLRNNEGSFVWTDGTINDYTNWAKNEPTNTRSEPCVEVYAHDMTMNDVKCTKMQGYICAVPKITGQVITTEPSNIISSTIVPDVLKSTAVTETPKDCGPKYKDWTYNNGNCYYYSGRMLLNWLNANEYCNNRGANLISIHSQEEDTFVTSWVLKNSFSGYLIWIGLNAIGSNGKYKWSDGMKVDFKKLEAKNVLTGQHCVNMNQRTGIWTVNYCANQQPFSCKRAAEDTVQTITPLSTTVSPGNCKQGWSLSGSKCFKVFNQKASWQEAENKCNKAGYQGSLASIHNAKEQSLLTTLVMGSETSVWVGMIRISYSLYSWSDDTPHDYSNWAPFYPTNGFYEKCIAMVSARLKAGQWHDEYCNENKTFVCQTLIDSKEPIPQPIKSNCKEGFERFGSACFKIVNDDALSFTKSRNKCLELGADLASINGSFEQAFIQFKMYDVNFGGNGLWLGLKDNVEKTFEWTDSWPIYFTNWAEKQPKDFEGNRCVFIDENSEWKATEDCEQNIGYICKIHDGNPPVVSDLNAGGCPNQTSDWLDFGSNHCYYIETGTKYLNRKAWGGSLTECEHYYGDLVSIHSEHELELLGSNLKKIEVDMWTGLTKKFHGGYEWHDNSPLEFERWEKGSENLDFGCVSLQRETLKFQKTNCEERLGYVCKIQKTSLNITEKPIENKSSKDEGMGGGTVAVIVVLTMGFVLGSSFLVYYIIRKRKLNQLSGNQSFENVLYKNEDN